MPNLCYLESLEDPRLAPYRDLVHSRDTRGSGLFIAEGEKLVRRLSRSPLPTVSVLLAHSFVERLAPSLPEGPPVYVVRDEALGQLVGFNFHRGVMACGRRQVLRDVAPLASRFDKPLLLAICPEPNDPENLGGIVRNLWAFGADGLVVSDRSVDPFSRRVARVSMGSVFRLPIVESPSLLDDVRRLREQWNVTVAATALSDDAEPLWRTARTRRLALVFGSEGFGLSSEWLAVCDRKLKIPMRTEADSLNVAVASGIFLYHFTQASL
jgi:tRNA G18 (ribose-2'-O)-methylase SpoU